MALMVVEARNKEALDSFVAGFELAAGDDARVLNMDESVADAEDWDLPEGSDDVAVHWVLLDWSGDEADATYRLDGGVLKLKHVGVEV